MTPSATLLTMSEPPNSEPSSSLLTTGSRKNSPIANTTESVRTAATVTLPISSPSASAATLAEYINARIPSVRDSISARTPRRKGTFRRRPVNSVLRGSERRATVPSGRRTAIEEQRCPRIRMPSITAWPP